MVRGLSDWLSCHQSLRNLCVFSSLIDIGNVGKGNDELISNSKSLRVNRIHLSKKLHNQCAHCIPYREVELEIVINIFALKVREHSKNIISRER